jgi:protein phosphatase
MGIQFGEGTHVGRVRDHNEDAYLSRPDLGLWIVADGMGGHAAGEVASALAIEVVAGQIEAGGHLSEAIQRAHKAIRQEAAQDSARAGMGCTIVALLLQDCHYQISWVGDSRAYLWDGQHLAQLSSDHSFVQQLIDGGHLTEEEARVHPQRNVITQALGGSDVKEVRVDSVSGPFCSGQKILLCSDGLTGEVDDAEIAAVLRDEQESPSAVDVLIEKANAHGGTDNTTLILVDAPQEAPVAAASKGDTRPLDCRELNRLVQRKKTRGRSFILLIVLLLAVLGGFFGYRFSTGRSSETLSASGGSALTSPIRNASGVAVEPESDSNLFRAVQDLPDVADGETPEPLAEEPVGPSAEGPDQIGDLIDDFIPPMEELPAVPEARLPNAAVRSETTAEFTAPVQEGSAVDPAAAPADPVQATEAPVP